MKWLLRGMAKRKEILAEIGPRPKYVISPELLQDCLNLTKDTFNTLQSIKQKRKEMDTHTNTQITDEMLDAFFASKHFRFMAGTVDMIKSWEAFKSSHSTVTEEGRTDNLGEERWYLKVKSPSDNEPLGYIGYFTEDFDFRSRGKYCSYRWFDTKELAEAYRDKVLIPAAPIPEEPKPVLPIVPVYLTQPQIDKLIEMLGGSK